MLMLALDFERRALTRSWAGLVALLAFLGVGALAIGVGATHVAQWNDAVTTAQQAQASSIKEARGYLATGESGPADMPWVDLSTPNWQDQFAGSRIVRVPPPLAIVAAGAVDPAPAAFRVFRWGSPSSATGYRIENPELSGATVDLVFVLAVLLPLLIGVLGLGIGARERESGLDRLVLVQAGTERRWMVARTLAVTIIAGAASTLLCLAAGTVGHASGGDVALLTGFVWIYALLWSGLLLAVNGRASTVRGAAFGFGVLWTLLCLMLPALATEGAFGQLEQDYGIAELDTRKQRWALWDEDFNTLLPRFHALYPDLATGDQPLTDQQKHDARGALEMAAKVERHAERVERDHRARAWAEQAAWVSPTVAMSLGLERLARVGPDAAGAYRDVLMQAVQARVEWLIRKVWAQEPLDSEDFEALVASTPSSFEAPRRGLALPGVALILWAAAAWSLALTSRSLPHLETR